MTSAVGTPALRAGVVERSAPRGSTWSRLGPLLGDRRGSIAVLVITSSVTALIEAATLTLIALTATTLVTGARHANEWIGPIHVHATVGELIALAFVLATIRLVLQAPLSILPARIATEMQASLRTKLFHAFSRASWDVQARDREGQLQEVMTGQVIQATGAVLNATGLLTSALNLAILLVFAFSLNVPAAAVVLVIAVALFGLLRPLRAIGRRRARALSEAQVGYARGIAESIRVAEETQVFGAWEAQRGRIGNLVAGARAHFFATQMLLKLISNLYQALMYVLLVGALAALYEVGRGHAASLGAVILILVRASSTGQGVQASYQGLSQALPFVERAHEAERRYVESAPPRGNLRLPEVASLAFEDVCYSYQPGQPVLSDISFAVRGGEVVGVIGPSGAGKSTLVQLLLGLRSPDRGRYLVNGMPAGEIAPQDWHRRVAYVPQEPQLLHASVAENIRYFRDVDDEAVRRAARLARIHEDILGWADGYETIVGPRADAVSGGQRQRICLARALVARPEVLVLDEPTSALDPHSEALIQESLTGLKHELTLFIVAHRMSTLDICDRVMTILDGRLAAFETIGFLRQHNSYYRSASQLTVGASSGLQAERTNGGGGRVPEFFIVGHPKCGTTALYEALRRHPQIYMPDGKEPWFFAPELHVRTPPRPEGTPRTLAEYMSLFAAAEPGQIAGEATALYLWSQTAAARIAQVRPDARIIAILREPASFLRSLHLQFVQTYVETEGDLRKALALEDERRGGKSIPRHSYWPQALLYSDHVRYVEQLRRYHEVFAPEQILVLIYDDFRADNAGTLRVVERFLGVDDTVSVEVLDANPTVRARSQRLHELVHALSVGRGPISLAAKGAVKALTPQPLRRRALHATQRRVLFAEPRPVDEALMSELRGRFAGEVAALSEYLGRDLVELWGYDSDALG